jgi:aspartyl-tRNA(Asn)/glutamyl-tRNA(Gln) amidotransferase subunit A
MSLEVLQLPVLDIVKLYEKKKLSPVEVVQACLKQVLKYNPVLNALCHMDERLALHQAKAAEKRWAKGAALGMLDGIPVTVKDTVNVKGWPTRQGSKTTSALPQRDDSLQVARLREAGAVFIGKTTMPEYGHKGVTDSPLTGLTRNPWNLHKTPGGSSGGAAVAAATGMACLNLGSDAGGSLRIPASFTGVVGFKPSPGLVPAWPASLFATLSASGPMTRSVADAACMLDVITRADFRDWYSLPLPPQNFVKSLQTRAPKLKIAYASTINGTGPTPDVAAVLEKKRAALRRLGTVEEIKLAVPGVVDVFSRHWMAVASYLVQGVPEKSRKDMDPRLLHWASRGDALHLHDYLAAQRERAEIGEYFKSLLTTYDLIVTPATPMTAFETGTNMPMGARGKPWEDWTPFTYPANLANLPAAVLPAGLTAQGLPVGIQLMSGFLKDAQLLQACAQLEEELAFTPWLASTHEQPPVNRAAAG